MEDYSDLPENPIFPVGGTDYCMLREPRRFHGTCSNGATCNAGGECVSGPAPEVRLISTPLPSP